MKKLFLIAIITIIAIANVQARDSIRVTNLEIEFKAGTTIPIDKFHHGNIMLAPALGLDIRYNMSGTPWDYGLFIRFDNAYRKFPQHNNGEQTNATLSIGALGNYNFRQGKKINPFAGFGIGVGINDVTSGYYYLGQGTSAVFIPQAGVELLYFLRLNAYCQISRKGYNTFGLGVGITIGGWPRKNKK